MEIGKLYQLKEDYWLLFPSKDIAADAEERFDADKHPFVLAVAALAASYADYWSRKFNCNVSFIPQNSIFMLLEQDGKYCKILTTSGSIGWIIYPENEHWTKNCIEEVKL